MKNFFILILLSLLSSPVFGSTENGTWTLSSSKLNQKIWVSKTGIAVGKQKQVTKDFSLETYLKYQKKYKAKALSLLGARDWQVTKKRIQKNKVIFVGHYTDQKEREVQFIETLYYSSDKQNLITILLTETESKKALSFSKHQKRIESFINAL